jgi:hypothetical protein
MNKPVAISLNEVNLLKKIIDEKFGVYMHMHDVCGSPYFSFDEEMSEQLKGFLQGYFIAKGNDVAYPADNKSFYVI